MAIAMDSHKWKRIDTGDALRVPGRKIHRRYWRDGVLGRVDSVSFSEFKKLPILEQKRILFEARQQKQKFRPTSSLAKMTGIGKITEKNYDFLRKRLEEYGGVKAICEITGGEYARRLMFYGHIFDSAPAYRNQYLLHMACAERLKADGNLKEAKKEYNKANKCFSDMFKFGHTTGTPLIGCKMRYWTGMEHVLRLVKHKEFDRAEKYLNEHMLESEYREYEYRKESVRTLFFVLDAKLSSKPGNRGATINKILNSNYGSFVKRYGLLKEFLPIAERLFHKLSYEVTLLGLERIPKLVDFLYQALPKRIVDRKLDFLIMEQATGGWRYQVAVKLAELVGLECPDKPEKKEVDENGN